MAKTDKETVETAHPLSYHLGELRKRVGYIIIVWMALFVLCFWQLEYITEFVTGPLKPYIKKGESVETSGNAGNEENIEIVGEIEITENVELVELQCQLNLPESVENGAIVKLQCQMMQPLENSKKIENFERVEKTAKVDIITIHPLESFLAGLKMAMLASLFFCIPFILFQIYRFVAPGLYKTERRNLLGVLISSSVLFFAGAFFVYKFVFPLGFRFFVHFSEKLNMDIKNTWSLTLHMSLVLKLLIAFGVVFELPVVVFFLAKIGIVNAAMLKKYRKFAIIGIFILAAVLTPPDVISQLMMAAPLLLLYEISIFVAKVFGPKPEGVTGKDNKTSGIYE